MKKILKRVGIVLLVVLVLIQFYRPQKNSHAEPAYFAKDISSIYPVPAPVQQILQTSCYDCHSNNTHYPWYSEVQPVASWLADHVEEGKRELNFSEFAGYKLGRQYHKLEEVIEQVKEGEMPLNSYTWVHKNAILTAAQKQTLTDWAQSIRTQMESTYPKDSLVRKKPAPEKH